MRLVFSSLPYKARTSEYFRGSEERKIQAKVHVVSVLCITYLSESLRFFRICIFPRSMLSLLSQYCNSYNLTEESFPLLVKKFARQCVCRISTVIACASHDPLKDRPFHFIYRAYLF